MTLHRSHPRARSRWLTLSVLVLGLTITGAGLAVAHAGLATAISSNYAGGIQVDVHGANDVPGQVDMTQMGRDTADSSVYRIFWSWDSISAWTRNETGDACALFNDTTNANIDFVVCARVSNLNADPNDVRILELAAGKPVYLFNCSDKKNDRCTNPYLVAYTAGEVTAGQIGTLASGNLITETDPFGPAFPNGPGEAYPHDTTIDVRIPNNKVPTGSTLVNVCSYPSAGNGGNNNPFDCIVTPGVQYGTLVVTKTVVNDNGGSTGVTGFSFKVNNGTSTTFTAVGSSTTQGSNSAQVPVGTYSVVEDAVTGYDTTYTNSKNTNLNCTSLAVTAGATTTCNITNDDTIASLTIATTMKWTLNDSTALTGHRTGGTAATATFSRYNTVGCTGTPLVTEQVSVNDFELALPRR